MTNTPNLNLKKPATTDFYAIGDQNDNMDILDTEVAAKEAKGKMTIGGTEYEVVTSTTDAGTAGKITLVVSS